MSLFKKKSQLRSARVHFGNPDTLIDYFRGKIQSCLCKNGPFCMLAIGAVFLLSAMFGVEALLSSCLHYSSPREIFSYYPALDKVFIVKSFGGFFLWTRIWDLGFSMVKYRGPILRVMSPALGFNDLSLDQSMTNIQIWLRSRDTFLIKLRLYSWAV